MGKWNLIVDVALCNNCNCCVLATKDEYIGNDFPSYAAAMPARGHEWIRIMRRQRGTAPMVDVAYVPTMCNHCDEAPCIRAAGDGSVYKRPDGVVIFDPQKVVGRKDIVTSCPYGAITWNEEKQVPQIWSFDAHLIDGGWREPRCAQVCPTGALKAYNVSDKEMQMMVAEEGLETLRPDLETKPRIYYRNLHRYMSNFVAGTIVLRANGVEDCVEGARISLSKGGAVVGNTTSNAFGEFKCDALEGHGTTYHITVAHGDRLFEDDIVLDESLYLGTIAL